MKIVPIKLIRSVSQAGVNNDDPLMRPNLPRLPQVRGAELPTSTKISYAEQKLLFGGRNIADVIREVTEENPQFLSVIANELEKFKKDRLKNAVQRQKKKLFSDQVQSTEKTEDELSSLFSLCEAYINKISDTLKNRYDETQSGMQATFNEDGQLIINGMNVTMFIASCRENPTPKARLFLKGIRNRLNYILANKMSSRNFERIHDVILELFEEIDDVLATPATVN